MILPSANAAPRLTLSQQALPGAAGSLGGAYSHFFGNPVFVRSKANSLFGNGVTTYIVLFTMSGCPSWPSLMPVSNVQISFSCATFAAVIRSRAL
jgi:hypothetical protein